jgi:hypothetical protein
LFLSSRETSGRCWFCEPHLWFLCVLLLQWIKILRHNVSNRQIDSCAKDRCIVLGWTNFLMLYLHKICAAFYLTSS